MPRTYHGRSRTVSSSRTTDEAPNKFNFKTQLKKFFKKMLIQTAIVTAIILVLYITSVVAPNFWSQINTPIRENLEHNIDFVAVYNGSIGRLFPNMMIYTNDDNNDGENELDYDYPNEFDEFEYNEDFFIEATEVQIEL